MAAALNVSSAYLSALEHGKRGRPTGFLLHRMIAFFNVIWDEAEELQRLAEMSDPKVTIDTGGLVPEATELTNRLAELSGSRIEPRFARLFLKLAGEMGRAERGGTFVPLALSRQELADMTGTTIETGIRIMSRWGKQGIVRTDKDGFVILDRLALESAAAE